MSSTSYAASAATAATAAAYASDSAASRSKDSPSSMISEAAPLTTPSSSTEAAATICSAPESPSAMWGGGKYFTSKIIQRYTQHIGYSPAPDARTRYAQQHAISAHCESLKRQLSTQPSARTPDGFEITREDFEHDIAPDIRRTIAACDQLLSSTGRCWAELD